MQELMDRSLKERVIGAIVLVVVAVLIVPVFLDGTADDTEIVSEVVTLPGQNVQENMTQVVVLNRDRAEPVPKSAPASAPQETKPEPIISKPREAAKKVVSAPVSAAKERPIEPESSTGMWAVQLGSFSNQENAERLAADLRKQGYAAFLSQLDTGAGALHRVRIGPQKDRDGAESVAAKLAKSGHSGQVVPHP
jgi:DedD protein